MSYLFGATLIAAALGLTALGTLSLRVFAKLALRGPSAADEAFDRGDNLKSWWAASQTPATLDSPRDTERLSFAVRKDPTFGEVLVEERASVPGFAK